MRKTNRQQPGNRAIAYIRVSTEEQATSGLGLAAQEERVRAYATASGLELVELVREEGVSGGTPLGERPIGAELLRAVRSGRVSHVVALKLDRLFRDAADCLNQTREWDRAGVALHLLDMGGQAINTASAMGRMFLTMAAGFAELERNLIAERTASALAVKRSRGEKTGGRVPFGYRVTEATEGGRTVKKLEPVPAEQKAIALVVKREAEGRSLRAIAAELQARGIKPREGATWHHQKVRNILSFREAAQAA